MTRRLVVTTPAPDATHAAVATIILARSLARALALSIAGRYRKVFDEFDYDKNGSIDAEEMSRALQHLKLSVSKKQVEDSVSFVGGSLRERTLRVSKTQVEDPVH